MLRETLVIMPDNTASLGALARYALAVAKVVRSPVARLIDYFLVPEVEDEPVVELVDGFDSPAGAVAGAGGLVSVVGAGVVVVSFGAGVSGV